MLKSYRILIFFMFLCVVGRAVLHSKKIDKQPVDVPKSVAIIMDGNGRWAQKRGMPVSFGHEQWARAVEKVLEHAEKIGIKSLVLYGWSTENWGRPKDEVERVLELFDAAILVKTISWVSAKTTCILSLDLPQIERYTNRLYSQLALC
ncbi:hypothetical protein FACS1894152_7500 [Bacilli bacterium]|nr:hypothetical protein FACS1894152_7500 [Bacilli bacterium]